MGRGRNDSPPAQKRPNRRFADGHPRIGPSGRHGDTPLERELAGKAAQQLVKDWKFAPINFIPVGHGITERIADRIRERGLLPPEEVNDSFIVAESALAACAILLSSDGHIREIPADKLNLLLAAAHVATVVISSPREIAKKFGW